MNLIKTYWPLLCLLAGLAALAFWQLPSIPFHPDESTQLFMSADLDSLLSQPWALAWDPQRNTDLPQHYRQLDAPLTRYLLGLARRAAGQPALQSDWDWGASWEANRQAGALPSAGLLLAGRAGVALLLPFSLLLIYLCANRLGGRPAGLFSALFLGTNALVLLHDRRAMAEGALTLGICLVMLAILEADRHPWLAGISLAVAVNAKQTALALLPVVLLAAVLLRASSKQNMDPPGAGNGKRACYNLAACLLAVLLVTVALNPLFWNQPVDALRSALDARQELMERQTSTLDALASPQSLNTPGQRLVSLVANLYMLPPAFAELGNYRADTRAAELAYLAFPVNNLLRGLAGGGLMLFLTLVGLALAGVEALRASGETRRYAALLLVATMVETIVLLATLPLNWQRYVLPLVPFSCLWCGYALSETAKGFSWLLKHRTGR